MAIVKMNKLSVIGMNTDKEALLTKLMDLGVVEINNGADKLQDEEWRSLVQKDSDGAVSGEFERKAAGAETALGILKQYGEIKSPLFTSRRIVTAEEKKEFDAKEETYAAETAEILELQEKLTDAFNRENADNSLIASLKPWENYDIPLELTETSRVKIRLGVFPPTADIDAIKKELEDAGLGYELIELGRDPQQIYTNLWYIKDDEEQVLDIVKSHGYSNAGIDGLKGTVSENIGAAEEELEEIAGTKEEIKGDIADRASYKEDIENYHDMMVVERDRNAIVNQLLKTRETFTFDGWVPEEANDKVAGALDGYTCWYEFDEPAGDEETPVKMKNNKFVTPMEFITKLYSLPNSREVDPTAIFTLFYIIFFGMMFADIGYGLILSLVAWYAIKKFHLTEGGISELMHVMIYCGISSAFWGLMFGSLFGDLPQVIANNFLGSDFSFKPLWVNPVDNAMTVLIFSCGLGVIHLFTGMGIDAYRKIKAGNTIDAINDDFVWYVIVIGILMWLFGSKISAGLPGVGKILTLIGFAAAILIPAITSKGVGKAIGLWNIYSGVTGNLSDILSYSRLLGLGLASASIAQVFNFLASMFANKGVAGVIAFAVIVIIGHVFNFAINVLGSFVHAARLQYVEFFGKFFDGGGKAFEPFEKDTKYVKIIEEGK